jgi:hypothetical protein
MPRFALPCLASRPDRCWSDRKRSNYISRMASLHPSVASPPLRARLPPCVPTLSLGSLVIRRQEKQLLSRRATFQPCLRHRTEYKKGTQPRAYCEAVSDFRKPLWHSRSHIVATRLFAQLPWAGGRKWRGCDVKLPPATQSPGRLKVDFNVTGINKPGHHLVDAALARPLLH